MWLIHLLKKKKLRIIYTLIILKFYFFKASFYNYINNSVFEFGPLDFPRIGKQKEKHEMIVNENVAIGLFKMKW